MPSSMSVGATLSARSTTNLANCFTLMIYLRFVSYQIFRKTHALTLDHRSQRWWSWCILRLEEAALTGDFACQLPSPTRQGGRAQCRIPASLEFVIRQLLKSISLLCEGTQDFLKDLYASKLVNPLRYLNNVCFHGLKSRMNWRGKRSSLNLNGPKSWSLPSEPLCTGLVHRTWAKQCPSRPRPWSPFPPHPPPSPM